MYSKMHLRYLGNKKKLLFSRAPEYREQLYFRLSVV